MGIIMPFWCGGVNVKETDRSDLGPLRCSERKLPAIARPWSVLGPPIENDPVSWQFTFWSLHNSNTAHLTADATVTLSCDVPCDAPRTAGAGAGRTAAGTGYRREAGAPVLAGQPAESPPLALATGWGCVRPRVGFLTTLPSIIIILLV